MTRSDINFLYLMILTFVAACSLIPEYPIWSLKVYMMFIIEGIIWYNWHVFSKERHDKKE